MFRDFCISVTFLDSLFHGKGDGGEPEWPPSPMRLFQALLAGSHYNREWTDVKADAFHWLEKRKPPVIITPIVRKPCAAYTLYVPNNDSDKTFDRRDRLTTKIAYPHRLMDGDTLYYLWSIDEGEWSSVQSHVELLCREARHLMTLGWGIDQVVGDGCVLKEAQAVKLPGQRWKAWTGNRPEQKTTRIPAKGSLENLRQVYESFLDRVKGRQYRPSLKFRRYDTVVYIRETALPPRPYVVFELPEGIAFRQEDTVKAAAMLRSLTCRFAKEDTHAFPGNPELYVAGHISNDRDHPRFSYLPLPSIGGHHADGMIRRLMIAEPFGGDSSHADWAKGRLRNTILKDEVGNERGILHQPYRLDSDKMISRYVGESRSWCSVTPVVLPGYDDFKAGAKYDVQQPTKAEQLLFKCLVHAGIPRESVESVTMRRAPFWPGSQHPRHYFRPDYLKDHHARPGWHVKIVFREPVAGPIAVGAGRHCGLGVFAAIEG